MGMTIDNCIHKLDFSIGAYQKLIDENVANGVVVGTEVRGTWTASTPLNKAYSDMIEALQTAIDTMRKYQKIEQILNRLKVRMKDRDEDNGGEPLNAVDRGYHLAYEHLCEEIDNLLKENEDATN